MASNSHTKGLLITFSFFALVLCVVYSRRIDEIRGILPASHAAACGDSTVDAGEQCDDGNTVVGDGCNTECGIEAGFICTGTKISMCRKL